MDKPILPIREKENDFKELIEKNQVIVVAGETGSGKTTQLPQICYEMGFAEKGKIGVTQPRRIAATATAKRVAEEMDTILGTTVGYKIRFAEKMQKDTEILFLTDGMLLSEVSRDKNLSKYSVLIIDEAHERSLNIDFILGYLRRLLKRRKDLKLIISSATIDTELFSKAFDNAPILEVSGRMFPVEVIYDPIEESGTNYIERACEAVDQLINAEMGGDILIFMPTERDILETVDRLKGRQKRCQVLPLFARLTRAQQNQIFSTGGGRKIVVATNIAETSLTVPGIRFVIDTGLARLSRYAPNLRTNRLPVEDISQAEANQRKGRCGRVAEGICIRLYGEKDFDTRPEYRTAEIRRSNLAGVILSLLNLRFGDIEKFPFLEAPDKRAISDAFSQLYELGATNATRKMTNLGRSMARLPLEPHISRMLLQAQKEGVVDDVAIVAAGLSIVDPRERPQDMAEEADKKHEKFIDFRSDFLTLLKLWQTYHKTLLDLRTQNRMRKFCKENFLSYNRMREWGDVHKQITGILRQQKIKGKTSFGDATENVKVTSLHRSILAGLVSSIAKYDSEAGSFRATRNRLVTIFPGSVLAKQKRRPDWLMAQEIVETSRTFARTNAPIDPRWIEDFVPHLLKRTYGVPRFDPEKGSVIVEEKLLFSGLVIVEGRNRFYGKVNPSDAKEIFIRQALIEGEVVQDIPFLNYNLDLYEELLQEEAKLRSTEYLVTDEELYQFYDARLPELASVRDLIGWLRKEQKGDSLKMTRDDLLINTLPDDVNKFPEQLQIGDNSFPLEYRFSPGKEDDGITVTVPLGEVAFIRSNTFGWLVPALWTEKIGWLLKSLPKAERKQFVPINESAEKIKSAITFGSMDFNDAVCEAIRTLFGKNIDASQFSEEKLPDHLKMRIAVVDSNGDVMKETRDVTEIGLVNAEQTKGGGKIGKRLKSEQQKGITSWSFGTLPAQKELSKGKDGFTLFGYPALVPAKDSVELHYLADPIDAKLQHRKGVSALLKLELRKEFDWFEKDLKFPKQLKLLASPYGGQQGLVKQLFTIVEEHILREVVEPPFSEAQYNTLKEHRQIELRKAAMQIIDTLEKSLLEERHNRDALKRFMTKNNTKGYRQLGEELKAEMCSYMEQVTDGFCPFPILLNFHRYMKAFGVRIEKAFLNTAQFRKLEGQLLPYIDSMVTFSEKFESYSCEKQELLLEFMGMVEEFGIVLFAQPKVKPLKPVSEKKLRAVIEELQTMK